MPHLGPLSPTSRRLATYSYLRPLVAGRRVVEVGCAAGEGAEHLLSLGATSVLGIDSAAAVADARRLAPRGGVTFASGPEALEGARADVVIVADAEALLRRRGPLSIDAVARALGPHGRLVCLAGSGDRKGARGGAGVGYYDVVEALEASFARVRMFGLTPFVAFGLAEFSESPGGLRVDAGLVDEAGEEPTHYVAVAGPAEDDADSLGYALVQVPSADLTAAPAPPRVPAPSTAVAEGDDVGALRRRLAEVQGAHDGVVRVSRAQAEEIEELRGRLRRGAEARAELDEEVTRLRRALTEADESVLDLTRRTTQEMASLAQRITSGLRDPAPRGDAGPAADELRRRERELAARESALADRDDRVAALEAERQDLEWRLQQATAGRAAPVVDGATEAELRATVRAREQTLAQFQRAAVAHVEETTRLRGALAEQSTLVAELEDTLDELNGRVTGAEQEAARLRKQTQEAEDQDRARRSRLSELEGTLLRLQRQAQQPPPSSDDPAAAAEADRRLTALQAEVRELGGRLAEAERARRAAEARAAAAEAQKPELERLRAERDELRAERDAANHRAAAVPVDLGELEGALREVDRLRPALQASEEQLWEAKGQLLIDRERITVLEHQLAEAQAAIAAHAPLLVPVQRTVSEAAHRSILETVFRELSSIEKAVRLEIVEISALEREIAEWRAAVAASEARVRLSP